MGLRVEDKQEEEAAQLFIEINWIRHPWIAELRLTLLTSILLIKGFTIFHHISHSWNFFFRLILQYKCRFHFFRLHCKSSLSWAFIQFVQTQCIQVFKWRLTRIKHKVNQVVKSVNFEKKTLFSSCWCEFSNSSQNSPITKLHISATIGNCWTEPSTQKAEKKSEFKVALV